mmetsp:Transcript_59350/g.117898  ORF Transcript_59350/g.117898 Transcript_59350/m.117898 type:complete len:332 (+) Transcript_59350:601-1596(+)
MFLMFRGATGVAAVLCCSWSNFLRRSCSFSSSREDRWLLSACCSTAVTREGISSRLIAGPRIVPSCCSSGAEGIPSLSSQKVCFCGDGALRIPVFLPSQRVTRRGASVTVKLATRRCNLAKAAKLALIDTLCPSSSLGANHGCLSACAAVGRLVGSICMHLITKSFAAAIASSCQIGCENFGGVLRTWASRSESLPKSKGSSPISSTYAVTPTDHMSHDFPYGSPCPSSQASTSGAAYSGEPASSLSPSFPASSHAAYPKSIITSRHLDGSSTSLTIRFSGLTSRWTTFWRCRPAKALSSCAVSRRALDSERAPWSSISKSSQPRTWSMTT